MNGGLLSRQTYVSNIDDLASFRSCGCIVGKGVGQNCWCGGSIKASTATPGTCTRSDAAAKAPTSAEAAEASTTTAEAASAETTTAETTTHSAAITSTAAEAHAAAATSEPVLANFEQAALPVIAVELLDGASCIVRALKDNNSRAFRTTIRASVHIGTQHSANSCCRRALVQSNNRTTRRLGKNAGSLTGLSEKIFQVLPADIVGKLEGVSWASSEQNMGVSEQTLAT
jgi:hypothetical protein